MTLLQALGLEPADYERPGSSGYGTPLTAGKTKSIDYDFDTLGDVLPAIRA